MRRWLPIAAIVIAIGTIGVVIGNIVNSSSAPADVDTLPPTTAEPSTSSVEPETTEATETTEQTVVTPEVTASSAPPTTSSTSVADAQPSSTAPTARPSASDLTACGLPDAVFCETFDEPHNTGAKTGDLDQKLWGVSRVGVANPGADAFNDIPYVSMTGCGTTDWVAPPADVRICDGKMFETVNDGGGVASLNTYPKQPFDFKGRTGKVVFDVSADSDGPHAAWPEFVITDKPIPGMRGEISLQPVPGAANEIGFALAGGCEGVPGSTGVGQVFVIKDNVFSEPEVTTPNCITKKGTHTSLNHFEVRISESRLEVWGTDAGSTTLMQLAVVDNLGLTFSKGLVWLNDVHYNARKAEEPCGCGKQFNHTFAWDNLAFDGPKTYRDYGFDTPDANVAANQSGDGDQQLRLGYNVATPVTLTVKDVHWDQTPTGALVVMNTYSFDRVVPSVSINGGQPVDTPWPYPEDGFTWRSIAIPVPLDQVRPGSNTITLKSSSPNAVVANVTLIIVAAGPVP